MWDYYSYKPKKKTKPDINKQIAKLSKKNPNISPVIITGKKIATTWWGIAWNANLEAYADYSNRIARGRSYVRSGAVLDLKIGTGVVEALVQGSRAKPYEITIKINPLDKKIWDGIVASCANKIQNIESLASGKFPMEMADMFTSKGSGLFPSPKEIHFDCSCPDWADMCKHVAAVLYAIGARFDEDPTLLFKLRDIDFEILLKKSVDQKMQNMLKNADKKSSRIISDKDTLKIFGV